VALQPPPHKRLVDLVQAQHDGQRGDGEVLGSPPDVKARVDADGHDNRSSDQITRWGKTHERPLVGPSLTSRGACLGCTALLQPYD
jgi:hypothetical protein